MPRSAFLACRKHRTTAAPAPGATAFGAKGRRMRWPWQRRNRHRWSYQKHIGSGLQLWECKLCGAQKVLVYWDDYDFIPSYGCTALPLPAAPPPADVRALPVVAGPEKPRVNWTNYSQPQQDQAIEAGRFVPKVGCWRRAKGQDGGYANQPAGRCQQDARVPWRPLQPERRQRLAHHHQRARRRRRRERYVRR